MSMRTHGPWSLLIIDLFYCFTGIVNTQNFERPMKEAVLYHHKLQQVETIYSSVAGGKAYHKRGTYIHFVNSILWWPMSCSWGNARSRELCGLCGIFSTQGRTQ